MTHRDVLIVSAVGALWTVVILSAVVLGAVALYRAITRAHSALAAHRDRRRDLKTCRAIEARGTTDHPQE